MKNHYRQGDVLVMAVDAIPDDVKDVGHLVLAEGEVTGHLHQIERAEGLEATLLEVPREASLVPTLTPAENERFLRIVGASANLVHEEHATIAIPPGTYRVIHQREWTDADEPRRVAD